MSELVLKLSQKELFRTKIPATKDKIEKAELELGLTFAKEYKDYLTECGCVSVFGHEFTGICKSERLDVVRVTIDKKERDNDVPSDWYVLEETHIDGICVWQDSQGKVYIKSPWSKPKKIANSFLEYLEY